MRQPPADLRARVLAEARSTPSPTIAERRSRARVALAIAAVASLGLSYTLGVPSARPGSVLLAIGIGGGLSALAASWIATTRGGRALGRPSAALLAVAVLAPLALLAVATVMAGVGGGVVLAGGTLRQHLTCVAITLAFALGPFVAFGYIRRATDPVHPRLLGAALGAAAGAWGGAMIDVHCSLTTVEHLALGHALPIVLVSALGALLGARVLGIRAE